MKKYFFLIGLFWMSYLTKAQTVIPDQLSPRTALKIDGQVQFFDAGASNRSITNEVTLEAWVRTKAIHNQWVVGKQDQNAGFQLSVFNGRAVFGGAGGLSNSSGLSQTTVNDDKWHHLAGVYRMGKWEIWVDGILENSAIGNGGSTVLTSGAPFTIARNLLYTTQYFIGFIGEIKLWNTARTETQIRTFLAKVVKVTSPELVGYFRCDSHVNGPNMGNQLRDLSDKQVHAVGNKGLFFTSIAPPIGDESYYYYGADLSAKTFKMFGKYEDTVFVGKFIGQAKGFHFYKSYNACLIAGYKPAPSSFDIDYYYGMLAVGDTNTTYQVKFFQDSTFFGRKSILYTRTDSRKNFAKIRPGPYKPALDSISQYIVKSRGELTLIYPCSSKAQVYANDTIAKCPENQPTTLTASIKYRILWSTGERTRSIQVTQPGKYWAILYNNCNIQNIGTDTFIVAIAPTVKLPSLRTSDTTICDNNPLQLSMPPGYHYLWPDGSTAETFAITTAGTYSVTVTDPRCGNSQSSAIRVRTVACGPEKVFIPNIITPNNDGFNDYFTTIGLPPGTWGLTIYNRWGKLVYQSFNYQNNWNAEGLNAGVYYYFFQSANSAKSLKGFVEVVR